MSTRPSIDTIISPAERRITLQLRCQCGVTLRLTGRDAADILTQIDASGWIDHPGWDAAGNKPARCPSCEATS